jgi:hypothetical protein
MKLALIAGGQPRFTRSFHVLMDQLKGFDQADLYMCLWTTPAAVDCDSARSQIEPMLLPRYRLKRVKVMDQPSFEMPPHKFEYDFDERESLGWWYKRRHGMWASIREAYDLIDEEYDMIIKFRPDGRLDRMVDVNRYLDQEMVFPSNHRNGLADMKICDQFVFGTQQGLKFYTSLIDHFNNYIPQVYPDWESDLHEWSSEHLLGHHMLVNKKTQTVGDYQHLLRVDGISPFDDKHWQG